MQQVDVSGSMLLAGFIVIYALYFLAFLQYFTSYTSFHRLDPCFSNLVFAVRDDSWKWRR